MKLLVINGVNLNMLGVREPNIYGKASYADLIDMITDYGKKVNVEVECFQSNCEGAICTAIQNAYQKFDGIIINAGAYTHTSIAILDALKCVGLPTVEVHISDINAREDFRKFSYVSLYAQHFIAGRGFKGYVDAIDYLINTK